MTSPLTSSMPHARRPSKTIRATAASVRTTRLSRPSTGVRYASAALTLRPSRRVSGTPAASGAAASSARSSGPSSTSRGNVVGIITRVPCLVDVVPAPRRVDRRVAPQRDHRVDRTRAAEPPATRVRHRRTTGRARGRDARKRTPGKVDRGEEVPASERRGGGRIVGRPRFEEDDRSVGILAQSRRDDTSRRAGTHHHPRLAHVGSPSVNPGGRRSRRRPAAVSRPAGRRGVPRRCSASASSSPTSTRPPARRTR